MWFIYILRCRDGSFYTGITTDVDRRVQQHKDKKGSKYVARKGVDALLYVLEEESKEVAARDEYRIKQLEKFDKLAFFRADERLIYSFFDEQRGEQ